MKLLFLVLLSVLSCLCVGLPVFVDEFPDDILTENGTSIEFWLNSFNETSSNDSLPVGMHGFFKKVGDKLKEKLKDGLNKFIYKIKDCKDVLKFLTFSVTKEGSEDIRTENGTSIEFWLDASNKTSSSDSLPLEMHGFFKKVGDKLKKVKDGFKKVKSCMDALKFLTFSVTRGVSEDVLVQNETSIEYWSTEFHETAFNDSPRLEMHGFGKKVVEKVKGGIKTAKDKIKGGFNKVKDKIKNFKNKIGSKGGSGGGSVGGFGGGYYRDKYDRDYNRDKYDRDYNRDKYDRDYNRNTYDRDYYLKDSKSNSGSGVSDPNAKWIGIAFGIFMLVSVVAILLYYKLK